MAESFAPVADGVGGVVARSVLVVEDEESYIDALVIGLGRAGFLVRVARTGSEALAMFAGTLPDVVLLDVMIPEISGVEVCRAIRATSNVPIVMVTARADEIDVAAGVAAGADLYLTKPYRVRDLVMRMNDVLEQRSNR